MDMTVLRVAALSAALATLTGCGGSGGDGSGLADSPTKVTAGSDGPPPLAADWVADRPLATVEAPGVPIAVQATGVTLVAKAATADAAIDPISVRIGMDEAGVAHAAWIETRSTSPSFGATTLRASRQHGADPWTAPAMLFSGTAFQGRSQWYPTANPDHSPQIRVHPDGTAVVVVTDSLAIANLQARFYGPATGWQVPLQASLVAARASAPWRVSLLDNGRAVFAQAAPHSSGSGTGVRIWSMTAGGSLDTIFETAPIDFSFATPPRLTVDRAGRGVLWYETRLDRASVPSAFETTAARVSLGDPAVVLGQERFTRPNDASSGCPYREVLARVHPAAAGMAALITEPDFTTGDCVLRSLHPSSGTPARSVPLASGLRVSQDLSFSPARLVTAPNGDALAVWVEADTPIGSAGAKAFWSMRRGSGAWTAPRQIVVNAADPGRLASVPALESNDAGEVVIAVRTAHAGAANAAESHRLSVARFAFAAGFGPWTTVADHLAQAGLPVLALTDRGEAVVAYPGTACKAASDCTSGVFAYRF